MSLDSEIQNALNVLRAGGTILYPTDTIWGIGCDATNEKSVENIFKIKKRSESKSLIMLVSDDAMLNRYVKDVPELAWDLMDFNNNDDNNQESKPLTIIYDSARGLAKNAIGSDGSVAVRKVRDAFCNKLIYKFGKPIISTSANISGQAAPQLFSEISDEIKSAVDYVVDWRQKENRKNLPSSIIKLKANGEVQVIRE